MKADDMRLPKTMYLAGVVMKRYPENLLRPSVHETREKAARKADAVQRLIGWETIASGVVLTVEINEVEIRGGRK